MRYRALAPRSLNLQVMASLQKKALAEPDRELTYDRTHGQIVDLDGMTVGRYTYGPGWRWIDVLAPVVGTDICHVEHFGYALSGSLRVRHEDGTETQVKAGDVYHISPRHLGEVVGDEPFETIEFLPSADGATRGSAIG
jgi:hypothetical protein